MDAIRTLDDNYSSAAVALSDEIKRYLTETAKWAKFIAIVGFVFLGLMVLIAIGMYSFMGALASELSSTGMPFFPGLFSFIYLVMAGIMFFPILYLYRFASNMQVALRNNDETALTDSFRYLKSHYKFYGMFMAITLGFYALMFVLGIVASITGSFM